MKLRYLLLLLLLFPLGITAQTSFYLRNNAWLDFDITLSQLGSHTSTQYTLLANRQENWQPDQEVFQTDRDSSVLPLGDSVIYNLTMRHQTDSIRMQFRLLHGPAGTDLSFRLLAGGVPSPWLNDGLFHTQTLTLAGKTIVLKFKPDNDDSQQSRDLRLAIHQTPIYEIDPADFADPNVINVMAYNVQFLPFGVVGLPQASDRGDLLPAEFSPYQDVIIMEEAFDPIPRLFNLEPAMQAAGFNYNSGILNDYLPFNGGVIIFSRWPIEFTDEYDFELCGPSSQDCLANKGIMYARINKLGKRYHIFGTHFDAGSDSLDLAAKNLQYAEMRDFIAAQNISPIEAVIMGGDLNTSPIDGHRLYLNMMDSLDPVVPFYTGFQNSTMRTDTGDIIDHVFTDHRHLLPLEHQVSIETFRSIDDVLWDLSDFSDHRSAVARFRFPDITITPGDLNLCPGDSFGYHITSSIPLTYQWYQGSNTLANTTPNYVVNASTLPDAGQYQCQLGYTHTYGTATDPVNSLFYPGGPITRNFTGRPTAGQVAVDQAFCPVSTSETALATVKIYPNPTQDILYAERSGNLKPCTWTLYTPLGQTCKSGTWSGAQMEIPLQGLPSGLYTLQIHQLNSQPLKIILTH